MSNSDEAVRGYLLKRWWQEENSRAGGSKARRESHALNCAEVRVVSVEAEEDVNDTGAVYCVIDAVIECPHGTRSAYRYDTWGDLDALYRALDEEAVQRATTASPGDAS